MCLSLQGHVIDDNLKEAIRLIFSREDSYLQVGLSYLQMAASACGYQFHQLVRLAVI